jgi:hypothetical protein
MRHPQRVDNMAARQVTLDKYVDSMGNLGSIGTPTSLMVRHHFPSRIPFFGWSSPNSGGEMNTFLR